MKQRQAGTGLIIKSLQQSGPGFTANNMINATSMLDILLEQENVLAIIRMFTITE